MDIRATSSGSIAPVHSHQERPHGHSKPGPGHIACSSLSQSEIVVPMFCDGQVYAVLDIDSKELATFDEVDKEWLEKIVELQLKK